MQDLRVQFTRVMISSSIQAYLYRIVIFYKSELEDKIQQDESSS